jgi:hypothetical protein
MATAAVPAAGGTRRWWSLDGVAAASGIFFAIPLAVGQAMHGTIPDNSSTPQEMADYYLSHGNQALVGYVLSNVSAMFFFLFAAYLWRILRGAEGEPAWLSLMTFGAAIVAAGLSIIGNSFWGIAGNISNDYPQLMDAQLGVLFLHLTVAFFVAWVALNVMQIGVALLIFRTNVLPRWVAWVGLADVALWTISAWPIPRDTSTYSWQGILLDWSGPPADILAIIWVIGLSIVLMLRVGRTTAPTAEAAEAVRA